MVDIAISAPARSIEAQATSISRLRITSRMETWCTSTSYIDFSSVSGSMPWDMVRLPCGSMSQHRTRWPSSANATARLSVVVVLATPPFWLANAITLHVAVTGAPMGRRDAYAPDLRNRQGWRREIDGRHRARVARGPPRAADGGRRACRPGAGAAAVRAPRGAFPRGGARPGAVHDLDRSRARDGRVPAGET